MANHNWGNDVSKLVRHDSTQADLSPEAGTGLQPTLFTVDAIALIVGMVIGAGIFETPALVATNAGNPTALMGLWIAGGVISLIGALCFGELATTYPHPGGNYHYLRRAFGKNLAFLFSWARMTVIQPGSIVLLAFVLGDYASQIVPLGSYSASIYATAAIALFTLLNLLGVRQSKWTQNGLAALEVLSLATIIIIGLGWTAPAAAPVAAAPATSPTTSGNLGLALVFVLLSYGGWNEAAYISAELRNVKRNMMRSLFWSIGIITTIYLLINWAYLQGLGFAGMAQSEAVASDLMRRTLGEPGAQLISLIIVIAALGSLNATIFTGARTNYALGRDFSLFSSLGRWNSVVHTPSRSLVVQGAIAIGLVALGGWQRQGFETMVDFTSPIYWLFFLLTGLSLLVLRRREPLTYRPFQVPLYPILPAFFCLICGYMLYSSLAYTGIGALVGVAVVLVGIPVLWFANRSVSS